MLTVTQAHPATFIILMNSLMLMPLYFFALYVFSAASKQKGLIIASAFLLWGGVMAYLCLLNIRGALGPLAIGLVPVCWFTPLLVLFTFKDWFLENPLSARLLVGFQTIRLIGGLFILEMFRGNISPVFAWPAGIGDMATGIIAISILVYYRNAAFIPAKAIIGLTVFGALDFLSAFISAGAISAPALQGFFPVIENRLLAFPIGLIPLYLVPCAIFMHVLTLLNLKKFGAEKLHPTS